MVSPARWLGKIGDEYVDQWSGVSLSAVLPQQKVAGTENVENVFVDGDVGGAPRTYLLGKRAQRLTGREDFIAPSRLQQQSGARDQNDWQG